MRSDNLNETMKLNRFFSNWKVIPIIILIIDMTFFLLFNFLLNSIFRMIHASAAGMRAAECMELKNILPDFSFIAGSGKPLYLLFFIMLIVLDGIFVYQIRTSLSDKEINRGQKGRSRWTTRKEIRQQYKAIPLKEKYFPGRGGIIVSRQGENLYIDDDWTNNLCVGTTRSGKGEMYVYPSIDVYSRAEKIENRPSLIINDMKLELYKSSKAILEARDYEVLLLNLDDPFHSMGYNPLHLVKNYYKQGFAEKAQMAARTLGFSVFAADTGAQEPIWKNSATDLLTALIIAKTTDCLDADKVLNEERRKAWIAKRDAYDHLSDEEKLIAQRRFSQVSALEEDAIMADYPYIPEDVLFYEIYPNEKKINIFSCLHLFRDLCDRKALEALDSDEERAKMADTALDEYFNSRPPLDFAKSLYSEIKTTGDRTKGSIYLNMQSAISVFTLENIARLTAENDLDIEKFGYGEKPIALFIGVPAEDKSNHFLVTTLVSQVYQHLFHLSKNKKSKRKGELDRYVKVIFDEFGNFPPIDEFGDVVTICLGMGMSFDIYVQALNQLTSKYKDDEGTILENFANKVYIKSVGNETAEEFSKLLGNKTIVDIQRQGGRSSLDKTYTESASEEPLMYPDDLQRLKAGECIILRGLQRTDRLGNAVESFPIINEYMDHLTLGAVWTIISGIYRERIIGKEKMLHRKEGRESTFLEELLMRANNWRQENGTALLYRYQYLTDTFPNPDTIDIEKINTESRAHINYTKMVSDSEEVLKELSRKKDNAKLYTRLEETGCCVDVLYLLEGEDPQFREHLGISERDTLSRITDIVCHSNIRETVKENILAKLVKEGY